MVCISSVGSKLSNLPSFRLMEEDTFLADRGMKHLGIMGLGNFRDFARAGIPATFFRRRQRCIGLRSKQMSS